MRAQYDDADRAADFAVDAVNAMVDGVSDVKFAVHLCRRAGARVRGEASHAGSYDFIVEQLNPDHFYTDPPLPAQPRPGEISAPAAQHALHLLQAQLEKYGQDIHWLGELVTEPRFPLAPPEAGKSLSEAECVRMEPGAKLAWSESGSSLAVYANGSRLSAKGTFLPLLQALCRDRVIQRDQWQAYDDDTGIVELLTALAKMGCVYVE